VAEDGRIQGDTQAGYALALRFDILPGDMRPLAVERLVEALDRYDGRLSTGIQTTHRMMLELSEADRDDLAYGLLLSRERPSWGYMIDQGATTIWERWDGYVDGRGYQDPGMNSFNHWALGSVGEWLYRCLLGLNPDPDAPGWKHFIVRPKPGGGIDWARGSYHSIRGVIEVDWRIDEGELRLDLTVPPNTTATVILPGDGEPRRVLAGRHSLRTSYGS
jgi:alpha-L-rhamnosidase